MDNPYWHANYKPHLIDRVEITSLCFDISNIVTASRSKQGTGEEREADEDPSFSRMDKLCFQVAEDELSRRILRLALLIRTFDDTMARSPVSDAYVRHRAMVEKDAILGATYEGGDKITDTIRECCNKIIHAEDFRPTYETEDDRHHPHARWGMTGEIELEGKLGKQEWKIVIFVDNFMESILYLIEFIEEMDEYYKTPIPDGRLA